MTLKNFIATKLNLSMWKEYPVRHFKDTNAMKWWVREKTVDYINSLTSYDGYVVILFHEFPMISEIIIEPDRTITREEVCGGKCAIVNYRKKRRFIAIIYNPKTAGEMCTDCLENMIIHEVIHINHPSEGYHSEEFYADYNRAVNEKNQKHDNGFFPISRDCKFCENKITEHFDYKIKSKGESNGNPAEKSMPEMQPVHVTKAHTD